VIEEVSGKAVRLLQSAAAHKRKTPVPGAPDDTFGNRFSTKELRLHMSKLSRNAPCPCGSGKKYKKCCLLREEVSATRQAPSDIFKQIHAQMEELDNLSNSVIDLIQAGELDEAEAQCHKLLEQYPDDVDGLDRLATVYEAKGQNRMAAEYYRKAAAFMRSRPGFDNEAIEWALKKAFELESTSSSAE
jgi:tetratricopeptide (TPR) repeat protein